MSQDLTAQVGEIGVVPVVAMNDAASAVPLADALIEGGLPVAEVTFRTAAAEAAIKAIAKERPDVLIGAGTVLSVDQAKTAIDAGARYLVSPGTSPKVVEYALKAGVPIFPGVVTPTDIQLGLELGISIFKFFPAGAFGGLKTLKALAGPFGHVAKFIPTGGIDASNLNEFISTKGVVACGGSWMVAQNLIDGGDFNQIAKLSAEAVAIVKSVRGGTK